MKQLDRLTPAVVFEINAPKWNGKNRVVGLALNRVRKHNLIRFMYRRKSDGLLSIPDEYYFDGDKLNEIDYERQNIRGLTLVLIPFTDLDMVERI